ncbi:MAG: hypothetical protein GY928_34440 [Colwellia sp.]|nr:hypothetical protein [Colwellia sp.]
MSTIEIEIVDDYNTDIDKALIVIEELKTMANDRKNASIIQSNRIAKLEKALNNSPLEIFWSLVVLGGVCTAIATGFSLLIQFWIL